jgi:hypothetical protein
MHPEFRLTAWLLSGRLGPAASEGRSSGPRPVTRAESPAPAGDESLECAPRPGQSQIDIVRRNQFVRRK